jgi:hypothetical protein
MGDILVTLRPEQQAIIKHRQMMAAIGIADEIADIALGG